MIFPRSLLAGLAPALVIASTASAQFTAYPDETIAIAHGPSPSTLALSWFGHAGRAYFLQYTPTLETADSWTFLPFVEPGANATLTYGASAPTGEGGRFFARTVVQSSSSTNPAFEDFDGDKVSSMDEIQAGLNPLVSANTDSDGLPDDWEKFHFGDLSHDGTADSDGDGLTDAQEYAAGRHPNTKIIYGTVIFYWKYEDAATKTVYFGDLANESTMVVTYSDTALTEPLSLKLYSDTRPSQLFDPVRDPENYFLPDPMPDPVAEYATTTPVNGFHALTFTSHTVNYTIPRTGRNVLRKIDGRPYKLATDGKRVAAYATINSQPLTAVSNRRFPAIYRSMPYGDSSITGYIPQYQSGSPIEFPDFGNQISISSTSYLVKDTLSPETNTYWQLPAANLTGQDSGYQIQSTASFAQWYNNPHAIPITLGLSGSENEATEFDSPYAYGWILNTTSKLQANDVGAEKGGLSHTIEVHFKLDYDLSDGPAKTHIKYGSGDDFWLFINGKLVIDQGGVLDRTSDFYLPDVDHGLSGTSGTCDVAIFAAERWGGNAFLKLQSSSSLRPVYAYQVVADTINKLLPIFSLSTCPAGMTISPTGKIFWDYSSAPSGNYAVVVEVNDRNGNANTQSFTITLDNPLEVKLSPGEIEIFEGDGIVLKPQMIGAPAPTSYQWYKDSTLLVGETGPTLTLNNFQLVNEGSYSVRVTNTEGEKTSNDCYVHSYY